jgi:peptidyl-prolyl cis-trans isomerase B (cyclophilin B)
MAKQRAIIKTNFGTIKLKFLPKYAPNNVAAFIKLAKEGYYNGTTFHRVVAGFLIQGGDPNTRTDDKASYGFGHPGYFIKLEAGPIKHDEGVVSTARFVDDLNTGMAQFFIVTKYSYFLDHEYSVFAKVIDGMDVVHKIENLPKDTRDVPFEKIEMTVTIVEE